MEHLMPGRIAVVFLVVVVAVGGTRPVGASEGDGAGGEQNESERVEQSDEPAEDRGDDGSVAQGDEIPPPGVRIGSEAGLGLLAGAGAGLGVGLAAYGLSTAGNPPGSIDNVEGLVFGLLFGAGASFVAQPIGVYHGGRLAGGDGGLGAAFLGQIGGLGAAVLLNAVTGTQSTALGWASLALPLTGSIIGYEMSHHSARENESRAGRGLRLFPVVGAEVDGGLVGMGVRF